MKIRSICACAALTCALTAGVSVAETWRGLVVSPPERDCPLYNRERDYRHSPSLERKIIKRLGAVYSPYTKKCFASERETDIEHIVALSEAHVSGLCSRNCEERRRFANDLLNLTLASGEINGQKSDKDAADWRPLQNKCWFAAKVVEVRRKYRLTIDQREAEALERVLSKCESTRMEPVMCGAKADLGR